MRFASPGGFPVVADIVVTGNHSGAVGDRGVRCSGNSKGLRILLRVWTRHVAVDDLVILSEAVLLLAVKACQRDVGQVGPDDELVCQKGRRRAMEDNLFVLYPYPCGQVGICSQREVPLKC